MKISDVLGHKSSSGATVATIRPTTTVRAALDELAAHNIGALVVLAEDGAIAGIVSERDIVRALPKRGAEVLDDPVSTIMTALVVTARTGTDVTEAMRSMTDNRVRHLPVVEDGTMIGIVSIGDIVKNRIDELQATTAQLEQYITG